MLSRLFSWFRRKLFRRPHAPILRLPSSTEIGPASETSTKPEPARIGIPAAKKPDSRGTTKNKFHRIATTDRRFEKQPPVDWRKPKPPPVFTKPDGARYFGDTLRTRNKAARTLGYDKRQIDRYELPRWETEADVAEALGISLGVLRHFSIHRNREQVPHYVTYAIPKRKGGERIIHAPKARLKAILRRVHAELVTKLPVSEHAHGFVAKRSTRTGAGVHAGKRVVMRLDLRDFFPTVTSGRVRGYLLAMGYSYLVAQTLAVLCTEAMRQPVDVDGRIYHVPIGPRTCVQGAPTSPGLCNAIVFKLDRRIAALAKRAGFAYTRYADDLTFSGDSVDAAHRLRKQVERVIREEGFEVNTEKTRIMQSGGAQRVTGVTVNSVVGMSRNERRRIRAMIHRDDPAQRRHVAGLVAYVEMLNPQQATALRRSPKKPR